MKRILLLGSSIMDLSINTYKIPSPGEITVDDGGVAYTPGGRGASTAATLGMLGAECLFLTKLGADAHGKRLYEHFKSIGINTSYIKVDRDFPTGFNVILKVGEEAPRTIYYPGSNMHVSRENIIEALGASPDALSLDFEVTFEVALTAARAAEERGVPIFAFATGGGREDALEHLPALEVFSLNEAETFEYTGVMPQGADSSLRAALMIWKRVRCKYLVIKQGSRGAFIYDGKHYVMIPAYRPEKVARKSGAGDAFAAAMTLEYASSNDIVRAVKYGCAAGAVAVSKEGITASLTRGELEAFINKQEFFR